MPNFNCTPKIFYGPPGTGKTTKLLSILEHELKTVLPAEIAYVSFTKEGTRQGVSRACEKFGYSKKDFPFFRTLHSIAFRALNMSMDSVVSREHYKMFSHAIGMHFTGYYTEEMHSPDDKYLFFVDLVRHNKETAANLLPQLDYDIVKYVDRSYKDFKRTFKLYDFTDMLSMFCNISEPLPLKVAFLDEAQDLSTLMWQVADTAFANCERIYIAGDDDQAIYQWSGADIEAFLTLNGDKTVLNTSHRLPTKILSFAKMITGQIERRVEKDYTGLSKEGSVTYVTDIDQVSLTEPGSYMFLARNNKFLPEIKRFLESKGVLYEDKKGLSIKLIDLDTIQAWAEHREGKTLERSRELRLQQAIGGQLGGIKGTWQEAFGEWTLGKKDYITALLTRYPTIDASTCNVRVNTIHTVKGAEANNVIMYLGMSKLTWESYMNAPDAEHRAFYVGATRAKDNLVLVYSDTKYSYDLLQEDE